MEVFFSPFKNPYLNLAIEDYFLRFSQELPLVFFYVNRPCVVFGRFQNPWIESNLSYLAENDIWPVRRQSGGGCVFHDEGNLNFSYITPGPNVNKTEFSQILKDALKGIQVDLEITKRNDLFLNGKKISGSAYKQTKFGSLHHGTFLVNSDLDALEISLKATLETQISKSISSVRSKVTSLESYLPHVQIEDVLEVVAHFLKSRVNFLDGSILSQPRLQESFYNLISWDWLWGETPYFETQQGIQVRKGMVLEPVVGKFSRETLEGLVSSNDLQKWFPDFSEQHKSSNLIF